MAALEAVAQTHREMGHDVTALRVDLADETSILELRDTILERAGKIEVLVNNAVLRPMKAGHAQFGRRFFAQHGSQRDRSLPDNARVLATP